MPRDASPDEIEENWRLVDLPLGEHWSGRARYGAAMFLYQRGEMGPETLEVYRLSARLDHQDPLTIIRDRGIGRAWLEKLEARRQASSAPAGR